MRFNENDVGKMVFRAERKLYIDGVDPIPEFSFIVGYDYLEDMFIISNAHYGNQVLTRAVNGSKTYSVSEVIAILDERIRQMQDCACTITYADNLCERALMRQTKFNYYNELNRLSNAYFECVNEERIINRKLEDLSAKEAVLSNGGKEQDAPFANSGFCKIPAQEKSFQEQREALERERKQVQKALHRLDKRFHFFFGGVGDLIKEATIKNGMTLNALCSFNLCRLKEEISVLLEVKKKIENTAEKFANLDKEK